MISYFELTKPKIGLLLMISTAAGMLAASGEIRALPPLSVSLALLIGGYLCSGGAGAFNCYLDRELDTVMKRTRNRPLPSGKLTPTRVLIFSLVISVISIPMLWYVNPLVAYLSAVAWVYYVVLYSIYLKRRSDQNIVIGGAAGAFPPLIGWVAITGNIDAMAIILFLIVFFWTPPHAYALMLIVKEDYEKVNIPMLPVVRGEQVTIRHSLIYSLILIGVTFIPLTMQLASNIYAAFSIPLGIVFVYIAVKLYMTAENVWALRLYKYSTYNLGILFLGLVIDKALIVYFIGQMIIKKNITKLFILVALLLLTIVYSCQDQEPKLDTYGTLPDFNLVDQYGYDYGKIDTEGKVVLANFVFTGCTQSCPVLTPRFQIVQNLISANDKLSNEVILLSFSVDPEHDVPSVLADYGVKHGVDYNHWRFLTGDVEDIRDVVNKGFKLSFQKLTKSFDHVHDDGSVHVHGYDIAHTNKVVLIDTEGKIRAFYNGVDFGDESDWDVDKVITELEYLSQ